MLKNITICICLIFYPTITYANFDIIRQFIDSNDANVTRVRTPEERDRRWKEFAVLDFIGLVEQFPGYTAEEYDVETKDGYILKLHRISGSPSSSKKSEKPVVFMGHCLLCSSDVYVVMGSQHALAFQLADAGYDVWIGNYRGNTYSKRHKRYSASVRNVKFWNFSMDQMGLIDLPLFIDTVLEKTNQEKLSYIGYSMGTTTSYMLLSAKPDYNNKMKVVVSIAPVAIFTAPYSHLVSTLLMLEPFIKSVSLSAKIHQIFPQSKLIQIFGKDICVTKVGGDICSNFLKTVVSVQFFNMTLLPTLLSYFPAGTSLNTIEHYFQLIRSGKFSHFDFGADINTKKYGASIPPEYNLTKISSPQAIFYSGHDPFGSIKDTITLKNKFHNVVAFEEIPDGFNHLDYMWHRDARKHVYEKVLKVLAEYR